MLHVYCRDTPNTQIAARSNILSKPWLPPGVAMELAVTVHVLYHRGVHLDIPPDAHDGHVTLASRLSFAGLR